MWARSVSTTGPSRKISLTRRAAMHGILCDFQSVHSLLQYMCNCWQMFAGTVLLPNKMSNVQLSYLNSDAIVKYITAKKNRKNKAYTHRWHMKTAIRRPSIFLALVLTICVVTFCVRISLNVIWPAKWQKFSYQRLFLSIFIFIANWQFSVKLIICIALLTTQEWTGRNTGLHSDQWTPVTV